MPDRPSISSTYFAAGLERDAASAAVGHPGVPAESLLDLLPDAVLCLDCGWRITYANREARRISRIQPQDLNSKTHWELFPETVGLPLEDVYRKVMLTQISGSVEYEHAQSGVWLDIRVTPITSGIALYYRDISDRKQAEARHDAAGRQLQQVLEATSDAIISVDRDWTITYISKHVPQLVGRSDLVGKNHWAEFPAAVDMQVYANYHRTMNERIAIDFEEFYPAPLNRWFSLQCRPSDEGIVVFFRDITRERAATNILLDQQANLAFVQETARVATWIIDLSTDSMTMSQGSYPVFGRPNCEVTTRKIFRSLVHPEDLERLTTDTRNAIEMHAINSIDYRVIAPDGSILWLEGRGMAVYDEQGNATHLRGMTSDITARKQDEERLVTSETRYRVLTDLNPQAIWMGDPQGHITYANQGFVEYTGIPIDSSVTVHWLEGFDPEDRQRVVEAWTHSVSSGEEYNIEARMIRASDRASRWWTLRGLPVRDSAGAILYWLGVAYDIHDARIAADELRVKQLETERQRAELETVYQTAPVGLGLFDPVEFRYLRLNDRLAEIIGLPIDQILGRTLSEIAPPAAEEVFRQVIAERTMQHRLIEGEFPNRAGDTRYFNVNYAPVFAADGSIQSIATATLDITHQKKAEAALIQSEKLAAVGRLASSISHEINNPLEAITNLLYLTAIDPDLPDSIRTYVHMAQSELLRVSQIATQTLRFHRQAVRRTWVTAAELVSAVLSLYQGRLTNSGIRIDSRYDSNTRVYCFENDIRQVLNNLIANAIDAMRGGGRLIARAHDAHDGEGRAGVRITIADTGHGMSKATMARVFEPFYTTKELNGTGLGLWISAGIIAHHSGSLRVHSSQDAVRHGTIFTMFLPAAGV